MSDNQGKHSGQDRSSIYLAQVYERRYWADKFGVTEDELAAAVDAVGNRAGAVDEHLKACSQRDWVNEGRQPRGDPDRRRAVG
jgi:hypothetical protein